MLASEIEAAERRLGIKLIPQGGDLLLKWPTLSSGRIFFDGGILDLARSNATDHDGGADYVGRALLAFGASRH